MKDLSGLVPPTVIAAAIIFALRETLELVRKIREGRRKIWAYKKIIAEELARNFWTWTSLRSTTIRIRGLRGAGIGANHKAISAPNGNQRIETRYLDGSLSSASNLPAISRASFERVLLCLAEEDEKLYSLANEAYDGISEIGHVRASLINELGSEDGVHLDGFVEYAVDTLDSAVGQIKNLYQVYTDTQLENPKLRQLA